MRTHLFRNSLLALLAMPLSACAVHQPEITLQSIVAFHASEHNLVQKAGQVFSSGTENIPLSKNGSSQQNISSPPSYIRICDVDRHSCQNGILSYKVNAYVAGHTANDFEVVGEVISTISASYTMNNFSGSPWFSAAIDKEAAPLPFKEYKVPFHQTIKLGETVKLDGLDGGYVTFALQNQPVYYHGARVH
ncbi:hypothetical protein [Gluconobacter frateurii]|uniref:hypothetical protein n=1 Tax=Gluconobacter frateurii TaxID=38308 RepID=UPI0011AFA6FE|nr:hypothetical protein [Gluconobacter frateurii]